jgi:hypothetical protein
VLSLLSQYRFLPGCQKQGWIAKSISRNALLSVITPKKNRGFGSWLLTNRPIIISHEPTLSTHKKAKLLFDPLSSLFSPMGGISDKGYGKQVTSLVSFYKISLLATASTVGPISFRNLP